MGCHAAGLLADYLGQALSGKGGPVFQVWTRRAWVKSWIRSGRGPFRSRAKAMDWPFVGVPGARPPFAASRLHGASGVGALALGCGDRVLVALLNNGSAIYEMGPAHVICEQRVIRFLCDAVGWDGASDGFLTHGGSVGNLTALLAARQAKAGSDVWGEGQTESMPFWLQRRIITAWTGRCASWGGARRGLKRFGWTLAIAWIPTIWKPPFCGAGSGAQGVGGGGWRVHHVDRVL